MAERDTRDAETIRAVLNGNVDRYAELVDRYQGAAMRLAFSLLGSDEDAKDVSQDAFVSAYQSLGRFRGGAKFSTWLYRIVVNKCKDLQRYRTRRPVAVASVGEADPETDGEATLFVDAPDPTASPADRLANRELSIRLSDAIHTLPMQQQTAFLLHHVQGLPLGEVASVMGCRVGTVKAHVFRAKEQLCTRLAPWVAQEGF